MLFVLDGISIFFPKKESEVVTEKECTKYLRNEKEAKLFQKAVLERYFYQFYLDDLPVWGMVGELVDPATNEILSEYTDDAVAHIYTHRTLVINYDHEEGRIITVDLVSAKDSLQPIVKDAKLSFELDVEWSPNKTELKYANRFERYLDEAFFAHTIHWFSLLNSGMMVLFLLGMMSFILLRTLRRDILKSGVAEGDIEREGVSLISDEGEMSGWKLLSTEVFRSPSYLHLLCALLGSGSQVLFTAVGVTLFCVLGPLHGNVYESRDELMSSIINMFTLSTIVAGYCSGRSFKIWSGPKSGKNWQLSMGLTLVFLPLLLIVVFGMLNNLSIYYGTIYTLPFWTVMKLFGTCFCNNMFIAHTIKLFILIHIFQGYIFAYRYRLELLVLLLVEPLLMPKLVPSTFPAEQIHLQDLYQRICRSTQLGNYLSLVVFFLLEVYSLNYIMC